MLRSCSRSGRFGSAAPRCPRRAKSSETACRAESMPERLGLVAERPRSCAIGASSPGGYVKPARVGFDSVRSTIGRPAERRRSSARASRLRSAACRRREENISDPEPAEGSTRGTASRLALVASEYSSICVVRSCGYVIFTSRDGPVGAADRLEPRLDEPGVRRQLQRLDACDDLVAQRRDRSGCRACSNSAFAAGSPPRT